MKTAVAMASPGQTHQYVGAAVGVGDGGSVNGGAGYVVEEQPTKKKVKVDSNKSD
jgi:hypothetical protein